VAHTEHIAERKTVGSQRAEANPHSSEAFRPLAQQIVPEQRDDPRQAQRGGQPETARRLLAKKRKLLMALNRTAMEKITDSSPVLMYAAAV
jgi:hypothetical protein